MSTTVTSIVSRPLGPSTTAALEGAPHPMLVGGRWVAGVDGVTIDVLDPATGATVTSVCAATAADVDAIVASAQAAFDDRRWAGLPPAQRSLGLLRWAELVDRDRELLAELESLQTGKPIRESRGDVARALDGIRFYAACARGIRGETIDVSDAHHSYVVSEPLGVVAAIVPWNVPIVLTVSKAAPALAAGNAVIVKPSQSTPLTALWLARLWQEASLPDGILNVVNGGGRDVGEALCLHPDVTGITFTGSTETGLRLSAQVAAQNKRIMLELGGKSPNLVFADADLDRAIPGAANAIFYGQGQICAAGSRLLVHTDVYDDVVAGVVRVSKALRVGDPFDEMTEFGALASRAHRDEVLGWVERARAAGATIACGGHAVEVPGLPEGAFMAPTVVLDAPPNDPICTEEVFGPVLVVQRFGDTDEAIALANNSRFGLSSGVWTRDSSLARTVSARLRAGVVWVNDYGRFDAAMPFGGLRLSGSGHREWSHLAMEAYLEHKSIWEWVG